jgi:hypothetical protein
MQRIGRSGDGYPKLEQQFEENIEKARSLLRDCARALPSVEGNRIVELYLTLSPPSLENLLALIQDLAWYKNWLIDHQRDS